jgi:hypothetical protein
VSAPGKDTELVSGDFLLEKYPGKGGWTFITIPPVKPGKSKPFGFNRVKGKINGFEFKRAGIWKMKSGSYFFPVNSAMRKSIGRQAGDTVQVVLYRDDEQVSVPDEILVCLKEDAVVMKKFTALSPSRQAEYIKWILSAKKEQTRIDRIAAMMNNLTEQIKMKRKWNK